MAKYYSAERGKYGFATGTIIAFGVKLDGNNPAEGNWSNLVPAGFLRCDGSILKARNFLALSQVLGIGEDCKFRKPNQELENASEDLRQGEFQLPDLGSKYMSAAAANGLYNNLLIIDPSNNTEVNKVGVGVELTLNVGENIEISYNGNFVVPTTPVPFSSASNFATTLPTTVPEGAVEDYQMISHGHHSNAVVLYRDNPMNTANDANPSNPNLNWNDRRGVAVGQRRPGIVFGNLNGFFSTREITITNVGGSTQSVTHSHSLERSAVSKSISSNIDSFLIRPDNITTTVNMRSSNIFKMDDIQHKFILVEFLIKT